MDVAVGFYSVSAGTVLSMSIDVEPIKRNEVWARDVISPMGAIREISWSNVGAGGATERERELPSLLMTVNKIPSATNVLSATMLPFQKKKIGRAHV